MSITSADVCSTDDCRFSLLEIMSFCLLEITSKNKEGDALMLAKVFHQFPYHGWRWNTALRLRRKAFMTGFIWLIKEAFLTGSEVLTCYLVWVQLMNSCTSTQTTQTLTRSAVCCQKYLKDIKPPRGMKHKVFHSLRRRRAINISQPQPGPGSLADCVLIEKERGTLIVRGHSFEVGLLHFKCLSCACLSPSGSIVHGASQREQEPFLRWGARLIFILGFFRSKWLRKK